jgi:hypothetical protein
MDFIGAGLANLAGIMIFALMAAVVAKAFQIASTLAEMKELLADIKRNTETHAPAAPFASTESADRLLRAVSAELDHPVPPAALDPEREFESKH